MVLEQDRLCYRPRSPWWWRPTLQFEPDCLLVRPKSGEPEALPWDGAPTTWSVSGIAGSQYRRASLVVAGTTRVRTGPSGVVLPATMWSGGIPLYELPALTGYLKATPEARWGLARPERIERLLGELATKAWIRPRPPFEPLLGDRLDIYVAVRRALDNARWRRFGGRPVRGEPAPHPDTIARQARSLLTAGVSARVDDEELTGAVARHLATAAWPFDVLKP